MTAKKRRQSLKICLRPNSTELRLQLWLAEAEPPEKPPSPDRYLLERSCCGEKVGEGATCETATTG
jgi:hypothetical protein